jgi:hypothetical protein
MFRLAAALLAITWLPTASAGVLYKCVGPKGQTLVQSAICPPGHKTVWARGYTPDRRAPQRPQHTRASPRPNIYYDNAPAPPSKREQQVAACRNARAWEAEIRRRNPELNYDQLLALQEQTAQSCHGL